MKIPNIIKPLRDHLKHLALGLTAAAAFFGAGQPAQAQLTYDFNDGTLQGWHNRVWDATASAWVDLAADVYTMPGDINGGVIQPPSGDNGLVGPRDGAVNQVGGNQDNHMNSWWLRSPEFYLDGSGDLMAQFDGGGRGDNPPANDASVPSETLFDNGFQGIALRRVSDGVFVLRATSDWWHSDAMTQAQLADVIAADPPDTAYTLDLLNTDRGDWGWFLMDNVSIPGTTDVPGTASKINTFSINGVAGTIDQVAHTITVRLPGTPDILTSLAPVYTTSAYATGDPASTVAKDFSGGSVTYTVTSRDGEPKSVTPYTVTVSTYTAATSFVTYDFTGSAQGWTQMMTGTPAPRALYDNGHLTTGDDWSGSSVCRSPVFYLIDTGDLTFQLEGGEGVLAAPVTPIPVDNTGYNNLGFQGVALRDVASDTYVPGMVKRRSGSGGGYQNNKFSAAELESYANDGKQYTLDFIDYNRDGWAWSNLDNVSIPGAADLPGSGAQMTSFSISPYGAATINQTTGAVVLFVPDGTNVTSLTPTIEVSAQASYLPASPVDFTDPVEYTVTSGNTLNSKTYTVTINFQPVITTATQALNVTAGATGVEILNDAVLVEANHFYGTNASVTLDNGLVFGTSWSHTSPPGWSGGQNTNNDNHGHVPLLTDATPFGRLMRNYTWSSAGTHTLTIPGLTPGHTYRLQLISVHDTKAMVSVEGTANVTWSGGNTVFRATWTQSPGDTELNVVLTRNVSGGNAELETNGYALHDLSAVPVAPTDLAATPLLGEIRLNWTATAGTASYKVKRALSPGGPYPPESVIGTPTGTIFTDTSVSNGVTYYYVVSSVNVAGESVENSNEVSSTPSTQQVDQTITFNLGTEVTKTTIDAPFADLATATSLLDVTYSIHPDDVALGIATVDPESGLVTILGVPGMVRILANQGGNAAFNPAPEVTQNLTVNQVLPVVTWNNPAAIVDGTALSATQLNATCTVTGTFVYTPPIDTVLPLGSNTLSVQFTPENQVAYSIPAAKEVTIFVGSLDGPALINVNYSGGTNANMNGVYSADLTAKGSASQVAPAFYGGNTWNDLGQPSGGNFDATALKDSKGVTTTVNLDTSMNTGIWADWSGLGGNKMLISGVQSGTPDYSTILTLTGLDPANTYDLYIAGQYNTGNDTRNYRVGATIKSKAFAGATDWTEGQTHVKFAGLIPSPTGTLVVEGSNHAMVNGFQLQDMGARSLNTEALIYTFGSTTLGVSTVPSGDQIKLIVPIGTALNGFAPDITCSAGATLTPATATGQDFSTGPVTYTVLSEDGLTTNTYYATVILDPAAITSAALNISATDTGAEILNTGTLVEANHFGGVSDGMLAPAAVTLANNLTFGLDPAHMTSGWFAMHSTAAWSGAAAIENIPYKTLLGNVFWVAYGESVSHLDIPGLMVGHNYRLQLVSVNPESCKVTVEGGTAVTWTGSAPSLLTATWTATDTTANVVLTRAQGGGEINFNGYALHDMNPPASFSGLTATQSITAGTASVTLSGTVSGDGPAYPADGETVHVTINGVTQDTAISGGAGAFSIDFDTSTIPAGDYPITYSYDGNVTFAPAKNASTTLTVTGGGGGTYAAWAALHADNGPANGDANNDGVQNGIAYFMGENGVTTSPGIVDDKVRWKKAVTNAYAVKVSSDLQTWDLAPPLSVTETEDGYVEFTLPTDGPKLFVRLEVTIP